MGVAPPVSPAVSAAAVDRVAALRRARAGARRRTALALAALLLAGGLVALCLGPQWSAPAEAWRALTGGEDGPLGFAVRQLRAPRALLAALAGASFGLGGAAFQTLLRNPLASPDIIGISSGAGAAAVFAIVILGWSGTAVSVFAVAAGLGVAALIFLLSWRPGAGGGGGGGAGARLILTGIGVSAMLHSVTIYVLARAPSWTLQEALRWMTGSVNGATLAQAAPTAAALALFGGALIASAGRLEAMRLGDDAAAALGVRVTATRATVVACAVALVAVATAAAGPVAFVAFLSGPIAMRLGGAGRAPLIPAALVGAALTLGADLVGQHLLAMRYPVGVVTGALGAPFLIHLIIRADRGGVA